MVGARQLDVYRVTGLRAESPIDLLVVLQDNAMDHLTTPIVAPLVPIMEGYAVERAVPAVEVEGVGYAVATHLLATIPVRNLGQHVGTLAGSERELKNAIDMVFFGV